MKKFYGLLGFSLCFILVNGQSFEQKIRQVHQQANTDFSKAYEQLNALKLSELSSNQKAKVCWYKSLISKNKDTVKLYASQYSLPKISEKNKSLLLASLNDYYLTFYWQPQKGFEYAKEAFSIYNQSPQHYSDFEAQYIINQYGLALFALGRYNQASEVINSHFQKILNQSCGIWNYQYMNDLILLNVVSNRPDIGVSCGNKIMECNPLPSNLLSSIYNNLGQLNIYNGNFYQAYLFQENAKENYDILGQEYHYEWYWHMGWLNSDLGNYRLADSYLEQSENMIINQEGKESYDYFLINLEKLKNNIRKKDTANAYQVINELENIQKKVGIENDIETDFLELKGNYFVLNEQYTRAILVFKKALKNRKALAGDQNFLILSTYKNMIQCYLKNQQKEKALQYIDEAEAIIQKYFRHSTTHDMLQIYLMKDQLSDRTVQERIESFKTLATKSSYNFEWKKESYYQLAQLYYSLAKKNPSDKIALKQAVQSVDSSYVYGEKLQLFQPNTLAIGDAINDLEKIRKLGVEIALFSYSQKPDNVSKEKLFYYLDYAKYNRLKQHLLLLNETPNNASISQTIQEEKKLRAEINSYYYSLEKGQNSSILESKLRENTKEYEKILQKLSHESKSYYDYFVKIPSIKYEELQKQLSSNEVFVSYTLVDDKLITLLISPNDFQVVQSSVQLQPTVKNYFEAMYQGDVQQYKKMALQLYNDLLQPIMPHLKGKKVLTSLDAQLSGINLETLITSPEGNNFQDLLYAIYDIQPRYVATGTSYVLLKKSPPQKGEQITFIAPNFSNSNSKFVYQPFVQKWLQEIKKEPNSDIVIPSKIDKKELLTAFNKNPTTILGTHTQIEAFNPLESKIIMDPQSEEKNIKLSEILNMQKTSDLVVLACCNTAKGKYNEGLSIMSIANGFSYSGSKSIICTLWEVDEKTTIDILKNWWKNNASKSNNQKLQEVKINLIQNTHPKLANPYYWGGIVIYGKDLQKSNDKNYYQLLILVFLLGCVLLLFKQSFK